MACVMVQVPPPVPRWQAPLWPFTQNTWLAMAVGLLLAPPILYYIAKPSSIISGTSSYIGSLTSSYFHVTAMHLREPLPREPQSSSSRVVVMFLWLYTMVLGISYCCNLTAFLTVTRQPKAIDSFRDLHASGLSIAGVGGYYGSLLEHSANIDLRDLSERYISASSNPESLAIESQAGFLTNIEYIQYSMTRINCGRRQPVVRMMKECAWPGSVGMGLQSYSPLKPRIDQVINRIVEGGLVAYWFKSSLRTALRSQRGDTIIEEDTVGPGDQVVPLNIDHMQGVFYLLALCFLASLMVFLLEMAAARR